jgi:hypothetical protein
MFFMKSEEIFNPDVIDCCIDIGDCRLENPPDDLVKLLIGKPLSECERIIKEYLKPKEKLVVKWPRKIGFVTAGDNR